MGEPGRPTAGISGPVRDQSVWRAARTGDAVAGPGRQVGLDAADRWLAISDGGSGLEEFLRANFPRVDEVILDYFHVAERLHDFRQGVPPVGPGRGGAGGRRLVRAAQERGRTGGTPAAGGAGLERAAGDRASGPSGVGRLFSEPGAPDGLPAIPGPGMADRIGAGGERLRVGHQSTAEGVRDALGRRRIGRNGPPPPACYRSEPSQWRAYWNPVSA